MSDKSESKVKQLFTDIKTHWNKLLFNDVSL